MPYDIHTWFNLNGFGGTRKDAAELNCECDRIRQQRRVGLDEVHQEELGEPTNDMAITKRHNMF